MSKLKAKRLEKGLSRTELARRIRVTYEAILHYERGTREPRASILKKLAEALECKMEDLI